MAIRSSWRGFLRLSLVSVPVKAYTASVTGDGEIHLNQLHSKCNSRIRYQKVCPIHGEVPNDEIISGYEYSKGQYVVIDKEERDALRTKSEKAINIDKFIPPSAVDPLYYDGRNYFLVPDGPVGQKPYALLCQAMAEENRCALAQAALSGRDQLMLLRAADGMLTMSVLNYEGQLKKSTAFEDEVPDVSVTADELRLARTLIQGTSDDQPDFSQYKDTYTERLTEVIEAKIAGQEVVAPPPEEEVQVVNLMDALRESVARAKAGGKPPKKVAGSSRELARGKRKRKTS